jgi:hypothetical protein
MKLHVLLVSAISLPACTGGSDPDSVETGVDLSAHDLAKGGRYFDKWYGDSRYAGAFEPDSSDTPGVADGSGGPSADGTLPDGGGALMLNDAGHAYRLKNFFGWDLRGASGVYGPEHQDKSYVLPVDLMADTRSASELAAWFAAGGDGLPALGDVLTDGELADLAAFVVAMRTGRLAQASQIWDLSTTAPKSYTLRPGGDADAGHAAFASTCAACHGADGTSLLIEHGEFTLGSFSRQNAYEGWMKVLNGHPGSIMGPQVPAELTGAEQARWILDLQAALCDRTAYPATGASEADVPDGDPRCGDYLRR